MSGQATLDKSVRLAALCKGETAENGKLEGNEETELNGVEEGRDEMSDEEGDRIDGEEELAARDWRVRARPETNRHRRREKSTKQHTFRPETGVHIS